MAHKNEQTRRVYRRMYARLHPEAERARSKRWRKANPEKHRQSVRDWKRANPERVALYRRRAKLRKLAAIDGYWFG